MKKRNFMKTTTAFPGNPGLKKAMMKGGATARPTSIIAVAV